MPHPAFEPSRNRHRRTRLPLHSGPSLFLRVETSWATILVRRHRQQATMAPHPPHPGRYEVFRYSNAVCIAPHLHYLDHCIRKYLDALGHPTQTHNVSAPVAEVRFLLEP